MLNILYKTLRSFIVSLSFTLCSVEANYLMAEIDNQTSLELSKIRQEVAEKREKKLTLPSDRMLSNVHVVDWSATTLAVSHPFHITLKEHNPKDLIDCSHFTYLESAIQKVNFSVSEVAMMRKYVAIKLNSQYKLNDNKIKLTREERESLAYYTKDLCLHVSLFRAFDKGVEGLADIDSWKENYKVISIEQQQETIRTEFTKIVGCALEPLNGKTTINDLELAMVVENIKQMFLSYIPKDKHDAAFKIFANVFNRKYKRFYDSLHIDTEQVDMSDEEFMEAYIKAIFLQMPPKLELQETTGESEAQDVDLSNIKPSSNTYKVSFNDPLDVKALTHSDSDETQYIIPCDNHGTMDSKNNFTLFKQLLSLCEFEEITKFTGFTAKTSLLEDTTEWFDLLKELNGKFAELKTFKLKFSGIKLAADTPPSDSC